MSKYSFLSEWDRQGIPTNLIKNEGSVDQELVDRIRITLPEKQPVPKFNPSYLKNESSRDIIIRSKDEKFDGMDITITFLDEGAGYTNVLGYYIYDLNEEYNVPTKMVDGKYVPLINGEDNLEDAEGNPILRKIIVFPNASKAGSGGGLRFGDKVKILYDPTKPDMKFPNNTGVGFFLFPNGWNGRTVKETFKPVYTYHVFNNPALELGTIQTVLLFDSQNSGEDEGNIILGFEDIMRPDGDQDFNDLIVKITYTSPKSFNTDESLKLLTGTLPTQTKLMADKTGLFLTIPSKTISELYNVKSDNICIKHTIKSKEKDYKEKLYKVLNGMVYDNKGKLEDVDENMVRLRYFIPKFNIKNYNYMVSSNKNLEQMCEFEPDVRNIVKYQELYIFGGENIDSEYIEFTNDEETESYLILNNTLVDTVLMTGPRSMGDPHIQTIYGERYTIPNTTNYYELYNDKDIKLTTKLDYYETNKGKKLYEYMTFMKYLYIEQSNKKYCIDLFTPDKFYIFDKYDELTEFNIHNQSIITPINEIQYNITIKNRIDKFLSENKGSKPIFRYYKINSKNSGQCIMEVIYMLEQRDYINDLGLISSGMFFSNATGALVSPKNITTF